MARPLGGVAKLAVVIGVVGSLVLSRVLSGRIETRAPIVALFLVFLVAVFALLGIAVASASRATEQLAETPRWSLRAAIGRLRRRMWEAIGRLRRRTWTAMVGTVRRAAAFISAQAVRVARAARAGVVRLREELTPERRRATWDALKRVGRTTLVTLGLPPEDEARKLPNEGLDAMPTLRRDWQSAPEGMHRHEDPAPPAPTGAAADAADTTAADPE